MAKRKDHREIAVAKASQRHGIRLITVKQTLDLIEQAGLPRPCKASLLYRSRRGKFPQPFRINGANLTGYAEAEVRDWLKGQRQLVRVGEAA